MTKESGSNFNVVTPSLPKGGGALKGMGEAFSADEFMGSASLSIPIPVSPCRDFEPHLSLEYNSRGGRSAFGYGFSLPLSSISRLTSLGTPQYKGDDTFVLSGSDWLVPKLDDDGNSVQEKQTVNSITYNVSTFIPRVETAFDIIERFQNTADATDQFWKVTSAQNIISIYGYNSSTRISNPESPEQIFEWFLQESYDAKGNHIVYCYTQENTSTALANTARDSSSNRYIDRVCYGNDQPYTAGSMIVNLSAQEFAKIEWHFEVLFDYGQYDISPANADIYSAPGNANWKQRQDPYSQYSAGFEIRTVSLCHNVLLFHRFEDLNGGVPVLTKRLTLEYDENPYLSRLISATHEGYKFVSSKAPCYETKSLPPMNLGFTPFWPLQDNYQAPEFEKSGAQKNEQLTPIVNITDYHLLDLYAEGVPGLLYANGQSVFYRRASQNENKGIAYGEIESLAFQPSRIAEGVFHSIMDINGNGKMDLVISHRSHAGFYQMGEDEQWQNFKPFSQFPLNYHDPYIDHTDITGDGLSDIVLIDQQQIRFNPSLGHGGFAATQQVEHSNHVPASKLNDPVEEILFADLIGEGLAQRVRISNGRIECWPNLSHGNFGRKIEMNNVPRFGQDFSISRLQLADIDGTGLSDLVYIKKDRVDIYLNQSGNGFAATPITVMLPQKWDNLDQISFADVKGNGTQCLVFRKVHPHTEQWVFDFNHTNEMQNIAGVLKPIQVPHLLQRIVNNMGAQTTLSYASSTEFYLADKQAGTPWVTKLATPINVVASITNEDLISKTVTTTSYRYHHGYYDGIEREFRGFGRVDKTDDNTFDDFLPKDLSEDEAAYHSPSSYVKTWYHTGALGSELSLIQQYKHEYWAGDTKAYVMPATQFDYLNGINSTDEAIREAHRVLHGTVLRSEIYGKDGTPWQATPYDVSESQEKIIQLQSKGPNKYAVFRLESLQGIDYDYARNAADPMVEHHFVLETDQFGHVTKACEIKYGRRKECIPSTLDDQSKDQQTQTWITFSQVTIANSTDIQPTPNFYHLGIPLSEKVFSVNGFQCNGYFTLEELCEPILNAEQGKAQAKQISLELHNWARHYYYDAQNDVELPLGKYTAQLLPHRTENIAFSISGLESEEQFSDIKDTLAPLLTGDGSNSHGAKGGYIIPSTGDGDEAEYYWNPGSAQRYSEKQFCLPDAIYDPFQYEAIYYGSKQKLTTIPKTAFSYDKYQLFSNKVIDPLNNQTTVDIFDYQIFQPIKITDINGNDSSALYDALGFVIVTSFSGTQIDGEFGFIDLADYKTITPTNIEDVFSSPDKYLQGAASYFHYNAHAWINEQQPVHAIQLVQPNYTFINQKNVTSVETPMQSVAYSDGFGRQLQSKEFIDAEQKVKEYDVTTKQVTQSQIDGVWLTSGAVRYDRKGQPIKQFEPFFSATCDYTCEQRLNKVGFASTLFYDAMGEAVLTLTAEGFIDKTLHGDLQGPDDVSPILPGWLNQKLFGPQKSFRPNPWSALAFDANDCINESNYVPSDNADIDIQSFNQAKGFANTPVQTIIGSLGASILSEQINVKDFERGAEYHLYDIWGNSIANADQRLQALGKANFSSIYNLGAIKVVEHSVDGGEQRYLHDVIGNLIYHDDARHFSIFESYDVLHRFTSRFVTGGDTGTPLNNQVKQTWYGDSVDNKGCQVFDTCDRLNTRGKPVFSLDEGGLNVSPAFNVIGSPMAHYQWIKSEYKQEANWQAITTDLTQQVFAPYSDSTNNQILGTLKLPQTLSALLLPECFLTQQTVDAIGRITLSTDADGNSHVPQYHSNGWAKAVATTAGQVATIAQTPPNKLTPGINLVQYNALGLHTEVNYSNGVTISYGYDEKNRRLTNITSTRQNHDEGKTKTVLQNLIYHHDPVGNVTSQTNNALPTVYFNNQKVAPVASYSFDSLYRLIGATGREQSGGWTNVQSNQNKIATEIISKTSGKGKSPQALNNYQATYVYDGTNNLIQMQHSIGTSRKTTIRTDSNRIDTSTFGSSSTQYQFDAMGNMLTLDGTAGVTWNYRNNMASAISIHREEKTDDAEYYIYDGAGQRVRKISESKTATGISVHDVLYAGGIEIRRKGQSASSANIIAYKDTWHTARSSLGQDCFCVWRYRSQGISNTSTKTYQLRFQLNDMLNSSNQELDEKGNIITYEEYYPYGGTSVIAGSSQTEVKNKHYRYSGKELDATGLYYYGMRYYAPWLGRWTCTDPAGAIDGLNVYSFVGGNPVTYIDKSGLSKLSIHKRANQEARRIQRRTGTGCNILTLFIKPKNSRRMIITMLSQGRDPHFISMPNELGTDRKLTRTMRKHTEAIAALIIHSKRVHKMNKSKKEAIDINPKDVKQIVSTNAACGANGENCKNDMVPYLKEKTGVDMDNVVDYEGKADAQGFKDTEKIHYTGDGDGNDSETDSDWDGAEHLHVQRLTGGMLTNHEIIVHNAEEYFSGQQAKDDKVLTNKARPGKLCELSRRQRKKELAAKKTLGESQKLMKKKKLAA